MPASPATRKHLRRAKIALLAVACAGYLYTDFRSPPLAVVDLHLPDVDGGVLVRGGMQALVRRSSGYGWLLVDRKTRWFSDVWPRLRAAPQYASVSPDGNAIAALADPATARAFVVTQIYAASGVTYQPDDPRAVLTAPQFSSDGNFLAAFAWVPPSASAARLCVLVWERASTRQVLRLDIDEPGFSPGSLAFSPDGRELAAMVYRTTAHGPDSIIRIYALGDGSLRRRFTSLDAGLLTWHPNGTMVVSSTNCILCLRAADHSVLWRLLPLRVGEWGEAGTTPAVSSDGRRLAYFVNHNYKNSDTDDDSAEINIIDVASGQPVRTLSWPGVHVASLAFTSDDRDIVALSRTGAIATFPLQHP